MKRLYVPFVLLVLSLVATCAPVEEEEPAPEPTALACYRTAGDLFCIEQMTTYSE